MEAAPARARGLEAEVLIPHWNRAESLRLTLESLCRQTRPAPVLVIDNASTDHTGSMLAADFPHVRSLRLEANRGFAAAVNRGLARSQARVVILLNNDAVADERFVEEILEAQSASGAEMVAACLRRPDGAVESLGVEVDRSLVVYDLGYGRRFDEVLEGPAAIPLGPSGGAAGYLREALLAVGGLDEGFFAYLEDAELAIRMRMRGMRCLPAPRAFAWHEHSATLGAGSREKNRLMGRSRRHLLWKHGANLRWRAQARGLLIDATVYAGQLLIDRNAGAVAGRLETVRALRHRPRPAADPAFAEVPITDRSIGGALRARLARRGRRSRPGRRHAYPRPDARG